MRTQELKKSRNREFRRQKRVVDAAEFFNGPLGHLLDFLTKSRLGPSNARHIKEISAGLKFN
jgi:hypothetical protein